jgi:dTDP-4-dehydrorhamnose reductase
MDNAKTLILGSTGFLGRYFWDEFSESAVGHTSSYELRAGYDSSKLITSYLQNKEDVKRLLGSKEFLKVVNCIALSDIDDCEKDQSKAEWLNQELPRLLAQECKTTGAQLIHISTDAVFSGKDAFSNENTRPNPISVYGLTKSKGEIAVLEENSNSLVCRVNFVGWNPRGKSLFNFLYSNLKAKKKVKGFHDIFFTPMYVRDTVRAISNLASTSQAGIFHIAGSERISKFEFGEKVARAMKADPNLVEKSSFLESSLAATRTADLSMSNVKIRELGIQIPTILSGIEALVKEADKFHG